MATLTAHWLLKGDARDSVGAQHGVARDVAFTSGPAGESAGAAAFPHPGSRIEVPHAPELGFAARDFSIALMARCPAVMRGNFGDILSKFDAPTRCGVNLSIVGSSPGYCAMSDTRHVHFGIDDAFLEPWADFGKPWPSNTLITSLVAYGGGLYAGIADADNPLDAARVFRWTEGTGWADCGRLGSDLGHLSAQSMLVHRGTLYAGTGVWDWCRAAGDVAGFTPARSRVFAYEGGTTWRDTGPVGTGVRVLTLASFDGALYAGIDRGGGGHVYRFEGGGWTDCGALNGDNVETLMPHDGVLYGATHCMIYRYEGDRSWRLIGDRPHGITQTHSMCCYQGRLHIGTWPQGYVLRYEGGSEWSNTGRLGLPEGMAQINEVNDLTVHHGKLYAGVLPKSQVYRYERDGQWTLLGNLASRPDWDTAVSPTWGRVTCLASFQGRLWAGTGTCQARAVDRDPADTQGRVLGCRAGLMASHERDIGADWVHLAAVREGAALRLYVNGTLAASAVAPPGRTFELSNPHPLLIGGGPQGAFSGALADMRLYTGALTAPEIAALANHPSARTG